MKPVLEELWAESWQAGTEAAESLSGPQTGPQSGLGHYPESEGRAWLNQIVHNRLEGLADLFAEARNADELAAAVRGYLGSPSQAELVAMTEVTRAMQAAAVAHYHRTGIHEVRWRTAEDAKVCPACRANEEAGPHPLGTPFPSGALAPPEHPRCRCALVPA